MAVFTVQTLSDAVSNGGDTSFRDALTFANANPGEDTIVFAAGLSGGTLSLQQGLFEITDDLNVQGDFVTFNGGGSSAVFVVDAEVSLSNMEITGGNTSGAGGGIGVTSGGSLDLDNSYVYGNSAGSGGGLAVAVGGFASVFNSAIVDNDAIDGGGIFNSGGMTLTDSAVAENTATNDGGGIMNSGTADPRIVVYNVLLAENEAVLGSGGGFYNAGGEAETYLMTVADNSAGGDGGGFYNADATNVSEALFEHATFTGNAAGGDGGAIHNASALNSTTLFNSLILGNGAGTNAEVGGSLTSQLGSLIGGDATNVFDQTKTVGGVVSGVLAYNGGPNSTVALRADASNAAIDRGQWDGATFFDATYNERSIDVVGVDNGGTVDAGAFEVQELDASNTPPVVTIQNQIVDPSEWTRLNTVMGLTDQEGDVITQIEIFDSEGGDNWWADGGYVSASGGYVTSDLASVWFQGDPVSSSQTLWVRAYDGQDWGAWDSFALTTVLSNDAPVVAIDNQTRGVNEWSRLSDVISVTDANNDPITQYEIFDSTGDDSWWADGGSVDASAGYTTSDLSGIWFQGDDAPSTQTLWVRAYDGIDWGAWDSFSFTTEGGATNTPPVATVENQSVAVNQWTRLETVASISDADGDAITQFEVWDSAGDDSWWADGGYVDASAGYVTTDVSSIWFRGDDAAGSQTLWVRAYDGTEWGDWDSFGLFTA